MTTSGLNKLCDIRDFRDQSRIAAIRELEPEYVQRWPSYPAGMEHRKSWEYAQLFAGLELLEGVNRQSLVLAVAPAMDRPQFALTRRARLVFSAGRYVGTPAARMLTEPEALARCTFDRNRLVVQHMSPADLRYEDETFDFVFCLGAGGESSAIGPLLGQMVRVCRTGGIAMLTLECAVNGSPAPNGPLSAGEVQSLIASQPGLEPVHPIDWRVSDESLRLVRPLDQVVSDLERGHTEYPHVALEQQGCRFTSLSLFLRKGRANG
jgi:hypothetical protein